MRPIKILLLIAFSSFWSHCASGQYDVWVQTGINISNFSWTGFSENGWNYKQHYFVGVTASKPLNSLFSVNGSLQYSQKGNGGTKPNLTLHYVDFLPSVTFNPLDQIGYTIGMNTGFLLNEEKGFVDPTLDLGIMAGIHIQFGKFRIHGHYNHGLRDLERSLIFTNVDNPQAYNSTFQIGVGYNLFSSGRGKQLKDLSIDYVEPVSQKVDLGVRLRSLNNFDFIFKKERNSTRYSRLRIAFSNFTFARNKTNHRYSWQAGIAAGIENRKALDDQLEFVHGIEPSLTFSYLKTGNDFDLNINPSLGYILGLYYSNSSPFRFGLEAIPSLGMSFKIDQGGLDPDWFINSSFSNSSIALVATYTLNKKY